LRGSSLNAEGFRIVIPPIEFTICWKYWNRVTNTYFGCTPIRFPTV